MLIAISGPDGTGKTTLAKKLSENIEGLSYLYFGSNVENRSYKYFEEYIKLSKPGKIYTAFKYLFIFMNDLHYLRLAKKANIISDRCPVDKYVYTKIHQQKYRFLYQRIILKLLPDPDLIILLEGDLETIYERKKEIPLETIEKMILYYKEYISLNNIPHRVVNTTDNNLDESYSIVEEIVKKAL